MNGFEDGVNNLINEESFEKKEAYDFVSMVYRYLDCRGYFMADFNIHNLPTKEDWKPYKSMDFGKWLLDMALQYNMEHGKELIVKEREKEE